MMDSSAREVYEDLRLQRGGGAGYLTGEDDRVEGGRGERSSLWAESEETGSTLTAALVEEAL